MADDLKKEYIIIYQSVEHFEVLGFVRADSLEEANIQAQKELLDEAKHYNIAEAEIAELSNLDKIYFKVV